jgi:hypothetical protein
MLRLFLLHPKNRDGITGPLTRYSHGETLTLLHQVPLGAIEVINLPGLNRIHAWCCRWMFRDNFPSLFAFFCRRGPIAFVIGPIKQSNGFQKFDLQKYFIPFTHKGPWALNLRLHRGLKTMFPNWLKSPLHKGREFWHRLNSR